MTIHQLIGTDEMEKHHAVSEYMSSVVEMLQIATGSDLSSRRDQWEHPPTPIDRSGRKGIYIHHYTGFCLAEDEYGNCLVIE
jgi:hypothetical protein